MWAALPLSCLTKTDRIIQMGLGKTVQAIRRIYESTFDEEEEGPTL